MAKRRSKREWTPKRIALAVLIIAAALALRYLEVQLYDAEPPVAITEIPAYDGTPYTAVNGNVPGFTEEELTTEAFELYSELDSLGRCGVAYANICQELMPTEKREDIGRIKPTGWQSVQYGNAGVCITAAISSVFSWQGRTPTRKTSSPAPGT
jgi:DNA-entry nuclease